MATSTSYSASIITTSSSPFPILTADDITCIFNKNVNARLAASASAVLVQAPPNGFKLKTFSGASKYWLDYDRSLTYGMDIPPFAPGTAELKTSAANAVHSSQIRTAINTEISSDSAAHFDLRDDLVGKGFEMVSILRTAYSPTGDMAVFSNFNQIFRLDMEYGKVLVTYMSRICHIRSLVLTGGINLPSILLQMFAIKGLGNGYAPAKKDFDLASSLFTSLDLERI